MSSKSQGDTFCPETRANWRAWLVENHLTSERIWLVLYKKDSNMPYMPWNEAVEEALCFGWIDGRRNRLDDERFMQLYTKRKPTSTWSKINKEKVQMLIEKGLMAPQGLACIQIAKENGSWNLLDDVEALIIPKDLEVAFAGRPRASTYFHTLSRSRRKELLARLAFAKREETRQRRIQEILDLSK